MYHIRVTLPFSHLQSCLSTCVQCAKFGSAMIELQEHDSQQNEEQSFQHCSYYKGQLLMIVINPLHSRYLYMQHNEPKCIHQNNLRVPAAYSLCQCDLKTAKKQSIQCCYSHLLKLLLQPLSQSVGIFKRRVAQRSPAQRSKLVIAPFINFRSCS